MKKLLLLVSLCIAFSAQANHSCDITIIKHAILFSDFFQLAYQLEDSKLSHQDYNMLIALADDVIEKRLLKRDLNHWRPFLSWKKLAGMFGSLGCYLMRNTFNNARASIDFMVTTYLLDQLQTATASGLSNEQIEEILRHIAVCEIPKLSAYEKIMYKLAPYAQIIFTGGSILLAGITIYSFFKQAKVLEEQYDTALEIKYLLLGRQASCEENAKSFDKYEDFDSFSFTN